MARFVAPRQDTSACIKVKCGHPGVVLAFVIWGDSSGGVPWTFELSSALSRPHCCAGAPPHHRFPPG
ncbi:hypothetical protein MPL1032_250050 [Mesorhizobium plurifarium]|uniref:Uncharacterized protein n=1 Tax=Mesorhizobium plurifarium TaxID=69974 RepID=A0A0K2W192_MESPL|nr:hypothetical protein MPL1032_250050 [Mesorhizobium plurifarium]